MFAQKYMQQFVFEIGHRGISGKNLRDLRAVRERLGNAGSDFTGTNLNFSEHLSSGSLPLPCRFDLPFKMARVFFFQRGFLPLERRPNPWQTKIAFICCKVYKKPISRHGKLRMRRDYLSKSCYKSLSLHQFQK
jgi:hypothetical protein